MDSQYISIVPSSDINSDGLATSHENVLRSGKGSQTRFLDEGTLDIAQRPGITPLSSSRETSPLLEQTPSTPTMVFSSSPVLYPASSSPAPQQTKKRKLFQPFNSVPATKKTKIIGGFIDEGDDDDESGPLSNSKGPSEEECTLTKSGLDPITEDVLDLDDIVPDHATVEPQLPEPPTLPPLLSRTMLRRLPAAGVHVQTCTGETFNVSFRSATKPPTYEETVAQRSVTATGRATKAYYGIEIHKLMDDARIQKELNAAKLEFEIQLKLESTAVPIPAPAAPHKGYEQMWTEKYRAKKYSDLVGDERTHRSVLRWFKSWDEVVFPGNHKPKPRRLFEERDLNQERHIRKILLLTGPPGLGKTTLAHVCARKAGYEPLEINASDDRSRDVVNGRIKTVLGTETVRGIKKASGERKAGRPVCVIVDEVDGVVTGSGGTGEGGFTKALVDLINLDEQNSPRAPKQASDTQGRKKRGDRFRQLRPLILICNDVYAPSLRPLRASGLAEIIHVRKPALDKVITRLRSVFDSENILCDNDAVRRICESAWGMGNRKQGSIGGQGAGEGDIRGILVQAEWMAHKFRAKPGQTTSTRISRKWVESQISGSQNASGQKGLGRGGAREVLDRIFVEGAGLANLPTALSADDARLVAESKTTQIGVADIRKRAAITALRQMIDTCGEHDRLMTDCFTAYPTQVFQDDTQLSKPNAAYDWLHFHDRLSRKVHNSQEWELAPYLSTAACGFHHLFASVDKGMKTWNDDKKEEEDENVHPFSGAKADFAAYEVQRQNTTILTGLQESFAAPLLRAFSSIDTIAVELIPNVNRMLIPDVKPVIIGGSAGLASVASVRKESEKKCIQSAVRVMNGLALRFDKVKVDVDPMAGPGARAAFVYRMEPPLDTLISFHSEKKSTNSVPTRYAVRQVLEQELHKEKILQNSIARHGRSTALLHAVDEEENDKENKPTNPDILKQSIASKPIGKRDFFGRIINETRPGSSGNEAGQQQVQEEPKEGSRVWVSYHEGFSNAVRKPITLKELLEAF